jgi:hypothetical protein
VPFVNGALDSQHQVLAESLAMIKHAPLERCAVAMRDPAPKIETPASYAVAFHEKLGRKA